MGSSSIWTIGFGTLAISSTSAILTGIFTSIKRTPNAGIYVTAAAINSAVTGATFFVTRECVVSPVLTRIAPFEQYARRRRELGIDASLSESSPPSSVISPADIRKEKLLDGAIGGGIAGTVIRGIKSGRRAVIPGFIMGAVVASVLQCCYNEVNLARLRYISKLSQENRQAVEIPSLESQKSLHDTTPRKSRMDTLFGYFGLIPVSDEEYIAKMKKTREGYLKKIEELEKQIELEKQKDS